MRSGCCRRTTCPATSRSGRRARAPARAAAGRSARSRPRGGRASAASAASTHAAPSSASPPSSTSFASRTRWAAATRADALPQAAGSRSRGKTKRVRRIASCLTRLRSSYSARSTSATLSAVDARPDREVDRRRLGGVQDGHRPGRRLGVGGAVSGGQRVPAARVGGAARRRSPAACGPSCPSEPAGDRRGLAGSIGRVSAPRRTSVLVLVGLILLSFNLRPAAVSIGPVLAEVRTSFGMSAATVGLLTSLPVIAFAIFGALAPAAARRIGIHRVTALATLAAVVGLLGRAVTHSEALFLALSLLALVGMAMANVLLPSLVKLHFPDRIGQVTAIYTTALVHRPDRRAGASRCRSPTRSAAGATASAPGPALAVLAAIPWVPLAAKDRHLERTPRSITFRDVARTRLGLAMALFFGLQSLQAYAVFGWFAQLWRDSGYSATVAGAAGRPARRHRDPALAVAAERAGPERGPAAGDVRRDRLLPDRLRRPDDRAVPARAAVGGPGRHRDGDVPADPHPDRAARPHPRGHRGAVGVHPVDRLPDRRGRAVHGRRPALRHRRLDRAAGAAARAVAAALRARGVRRAGAYVEDQLAAGFRRLPGETHRPTSHRQRERSPP